MKIFDEFDSNLRKKIKAGSRVAILPIGSIEQHGPHLPVSTDSVISTEIAKRISKKCNYLLLPTIFYGVSFEHTPFFNLSLSNKTLSSIVKNICKSLFDNGIKIVFVINGHYGNQKALNALNNFKSKRGKVFVFSYWKFMSGQFDHAGFVETSIMLAISKNVNMKKAKKGKIPENLSKKDKSLLQKLARKSFPKVTGNGVWGDPTSASAKQGKLILSEIVENLIKTSQTCLTGKNRKLHQ